MRFISCLALLFWASLSAAQPYRIELVSGGFQGPWSIGFLPTGEVLVTEKRGKLFLLGKDGSRAEINGLPAIRQIGQGGLFDVLPAFDFAQSGVLYLSYALDSGSSIGTAVSKARLNGLQLENLEEVFAMQTDSQSGRHFGGRLAQDARGNLFLTMGDRGDRPAAQDDARHNGMIVRIEPSGTVKNWTKGHRNPQGLAFDAQGQLWAHEHGAQGGDEINRIEDGKNYGWPIIAYGKHYSGAKIGEGTAKDGLEQPVFYWDPSIAPSGFAIHSGEGWPDMAGKFLVGSLKFDMISVLAAGGTQELERISTPETLRVRDVRIGPQGAIWFLSEGNGALYRITAP